MQGFQQQQNSHSPCDELSREQIVSPDDNTPRNTPSILSQCLISPLFEEHPIIRFTDYMNPPLTCQDIIANRLGWTALYITLSIINIDNYIKHIHVTVPNPEEMVNQIANTILNHGNLSAFTNHSAHNHTKIPSSDVFTDSVAFAQTFNFFVWSTAILTVFIFVASKLGVKTASCILKKENKISFSDIFTNRALNFPSKHILTAILIYNNLQNIPTYLEKTRAILNKDSQTALFHSDFFKEQKTRPQLCTPELHYALHPSIYQFYDLSSCSNLLQARARPAFGYVYLPAVINVIRYYTLFKVVTGGLFLLYKITDGILNYFRSPLPQAYERWAKEQLISSTSTNTQPIKDYQARKTFLSRYLSLYTTKTPAIQQPQQQTSFLKKIADFINQSIKNFDSLCRLTLATLAGIALYYLIIRMIRTLDNNEICNSPAEWQWFDDCYGQSDTFSMANKSYAFRFISKTHHQDTNNLFPFLNTNHTLVTKTAYLVNTKHPDMFIDLILDEETHAKNSNKITLLSSNAGAEIEKITPYAVILFSATYGFSILSALCSNLFSATCPESKTHLMKSHAYRTSELAWKKIDFSFANSISLATSINSYFYMALLLSVGLMSGIKETGLGWNEFDFLSHIIQTMIFDATTHHPSNSTQFNQTENTNSYVYEISGSSQLYIYSGVIYTFPAIILACGLRNFICKLSCGMRTKKSNQINTDYVPLSDIFVPTNENEALSSPGHAIERKENNLT